jgi:hypothetical protein
MLMNLFDLIFLVLALTTLISLIAACILALSGRRSQAARILRRLAAGAAVYFSIVIVVSLIEPRRIVNMGDDQCFDDWCIAAVSSSSSPAPSGLSYLVSLRISSRARRVAQRELNMAVYLTDKNGHRYVSSPRPSDVPLDILLEPRQGVDLSRLFSVPASARDLNLVITHDGGFPINWFIIGYDAWFHQPPVIRLS